MDRIDLLADILDTHAPIAAAGLLLPDAALEAAAPEMPDFARKDVLAHVAWWNDHATAVLRGVRSGEDPFPPGPEPWDLDAQNAATLASNHERAAREVVAWEAASFDALAAAVVAATSEELATAGYRAWLGDGSAAGVVIADSTEHYPEHVPHLAWIAQGADRRVHAAVTARDVAWLRELIDDGAPLDTRDADLRTPLVLATRAGHAEMARLLLEAGADVDARDRLLDTPLLAAGRAGDTALLEVLAAGGANPTLTNRYGGTALIPACERGHEAAVRFLLERTTVDVDHRNRLGWTGLMEAVLLADGGPVHQRIVALLLDHGADPAIPDHDGRTALDHARRLGFTRLVHLLEPRR